MIATTDRQTEQPHPQLMRRSVRRRVRGVSFCAEFNHTVRAESQLASRAAKKLLPLRCCNPQIPGRSALEFSRRCLRLEQGYSSSLELEVRRQRWTQPSDSRGLACQSPNVGVTSKSHTRPEPSKTPPIGRQPDNTLLAKACRDLHSMSAMDSSSEPPRKLQSFSFDIVTRYNTESILRSYACNFRQCQEDR